MTRPLIFLDFDGVLNSHAWIDRRPKGVSKCDLGINQFDPAAVGLLNQLIVRTGADIVISSTWRMDGLHSCKSLLDQRGFIGKVVAATPVLQRERGHEIQWWLDHAQIKPEHIVILDDDGDMVHLAPWLVQTQFEHGLQQQHVDRACELLRSAPPAMRPHEEDGV